MYWGLRICLSGVVGVHMRYLNMFVIMLGVLVQAYIFNVVLRFYNMLRGLDETDLRALRLLSDPALVS